MVAPTLTSISPDYGKPSGKYLLTITGSNFELPPDPPTEGFVGGEPPVSMEVEINGRPCSNVWVFTDTILTCLAPAYRGDPDLLSSDPGYPVEVVLRNVTGPEETAYPDAFTYKRADLTRGDGVLRFVVRTLIKELRRQVLDNVAISQAVDYDASTGDQLDIVELAGIPGIALFGPNIVEDKFYRNSVKRQARNLTSLEYTKYNVPMVGTIRFDVTLTGSSSGELLNLAQEFILFFRNNRQLEVLSDSSDPDSEYVRFEMFLIDLPSRSGQANEHDVREMSASFEIRGVPIDEDQFMAIEWGKIIDDPADVELSTEQEL